MSSFSDFVSLVAVVCLFGAIIAGVMYVGNMVSAAVASTQENLKKRGVDVSKDGVSVKTNRRGVDREQVMDATQRGLVNVLNNAQYGSPNAPRNVADHLSHRRNPSKPHMRDLTPSSR
ncbi:hypothetical protein AURDEDRAFT_159890 [Auricularia subglabra TFB-10046 SS5]|nr:hypothetical protein AURDEDRAFT_159890 [Auricularia subglabra TFB-10046 SS5]